MYKFATLVEKLLENAFAEYQLENEFIAEMQTHTLAELDQLTETMFGIAQKVLDRMQIELPGRISIDRVRDFLAARMEWDVTDMTAEFDELFDDLPSDDPDDDPDDLDDRIAQIIAELEAINRMGE